MYEDDLPGRCQIRSLKKCNYTSTTTTEGEYELSGKKMAQHSVEKEIGSVRDRMTWAIFEGTNLASVVWNQHFFPVDLALLLRAALAERPWPNPARAGVRMSFRIRSRAADRHELHRPLAERKLPTTISASATLDGSPAT